MIYRLFLVSQVIFLLLIPDCFSDEFSGYKSRWPVVQTKAIATDETLDVVYVGDGDTLSVFTKSNLARINFIRLNDITEGIRALVYSPLHKTVYAACGGSGIHVIDVTTPDAPTTATTLQVKTSSHVTQNDRLNGINSTDVNAYDVTIYGNHMFVADFDYGLRIYKLTSATHPVEVGWMDLKSTDSVYSMRNLDVYSEGGILFVIALMNTNSGYPVIGRIGFSIDSETEFIEELSLSTATGLSSLLGASSLIVQGRYAYCLDEISNYFIVFDVHHNTQGSPLLIYPKPDNGHIENKLYLGQPRGLAVKGNYAYVATYYRYLSNQDTSIGTEPGLHIIDITEPYAPKAITGIGHKVEGANSVFADGSNAYITSHSKGLHKLDIAFSSGGATVSETIGAAKTAFNVSDVTIVNNELLYMVDNINSNRNGITLIRIKPDKQDKLLTAKASPGYPLYEAFLPTPGQAKAFCINDHLQYGYIADGSAGIQFVKYESTGGIKAPALITGSSIAAPVGFEVISLAINNNLLFALTSDPAQELWVIDVSKDTYFDNPTTYTPLPLDIKGDADAKSIHVYGKYAMIPAGANGLIIIDTCYGEENTGEITFPPADDVIIVPADNALAVFSDPEVTGHYAFLADKSPEGNLNIHTIRLYKETNIADMAPEIISTFDFSGSDRLDNTGDLSTILDLCFFDNSLYVATDSKSKALVILNMLDIENPVYAGSTSSYGNAATINTATIELGCNENDMECEGDIRNSFKIKGSYLADGSGGVSIMQLTDDPNSGYLDRLWNDDTIDFCFISTTETNRPQTGLFPVFVFLFICLVIVLIISILIVVHARKKNQ